MSRLYIANVSTQRQVVCYRLDYGKDGELKDVNRKFEPAKQQDIEPGRQVQIGGDFHMSQITDIVDQLGKYGLIATADVPRLDRRVHPYIYNIDRPVPRDAMEKVRANNLASLVVQGQERRKKAAVATNDIVQTTVASQFAQSGIEAEPSDRTEVSFEQEEQTEAGEKRVEEGFRVVPDSGARAPAPVAKKRGRPRKA
jgi:hypothetical protein